MTVFNKEDLNIRERKLSHHRYISNSMPLSCWPTKMPGISTLHCKRLKNSTPTSQTYKLITSFLGHSWFRWSKNNMCGWYCQESRDYIQQGRSKLKNRESNDCIQQGRSKHKQQKILVPVLHQVIFFSSKNQYYT